MDFSKQMTTRFRAFDSESTFRMYKPEEVWVCDDVAWIIDNDSWDEELVFNNDLIIMQSTGLTDYKGREIFEGDVVMMSMIHYSHPTYYEVVRSIGGTYRLESSQHGCELWLRHADCYIVGNIYENPELLEEVYK